MDAWLTEFDFYMKKFFAIDHQDAGMDEHQLARYRDLPAREAALTYGEDYDLDRVDQGWNR